MKLKLLLKRAMGVTGLFLAAQVVSAQPVTVTVTVNQPPLLTASAGADQFVCFGDTLGIGGNPTAGGGSGPFTYAWAPGAGLSSTTVANPDATPTAVNSINTYTVSITDARNCTAMDSVVVSDTCTPAGFSGVPGVASMSIFPNPNNGVFAVELNLLTHPGSATITVTSIDGRKVYAKSWDKPSSNVKENINITASGKGVYLVEMNIDDRKYSRKIVVQ